MRWRDEWNGGGGIEVTGHIAMAPLIIIIKLLLFYHKFYISFSIANDIIINCIRPNKPEPYSNFIEKKRTVWRHKCLMFIVCYLFVCLFVCCYLALHANEFDGIYVRCHFLKSFFATNHFIWFTQLNFTHFQRHSANNIQKRKNK